MAVLQTEIFGVKPADMLLLMLCSDSIRLLLPLTVSHWRVICSETALTRKNRGGGIMVFPSLLRQLSRHT